MKRLLVVVFAAIAIAGGLAVTGHLPLGESWPRLLQPDAKKTQALPPVLPAVSVIRVEPAQFVETVLVTGTLVPREEIMVAPEVEGLRVIDLLVDEGDPVRNGQILAVLQHETLDAQLAQNAASLARADAGIAQARSAISQAEARLEEARNAFERAKALRQSGHLSESIYDQRESAARTAEAALVAARDGLKVAEAEKAQIDAQRRELLWRRANTEVKAPADGLISRRSARVGALSSGVSDPMFRIIARGEIELDAEVPEVSLARMKPGQTATVSVAGSGDVAGQVRLVSPEVDRLTRLGRVRISLEDSQGLRIGGYARGIVVTASGSGLSLPASAILYGPDGPSVQVVESGRISTRRIRTGLRDRGLVEIAEGVSPHDVVVARSGTFLREGDEIRAVFEPAGRMSEAR